jgi:uncharacterized protein (DUF362 family)
VHVSLSTTPEIPETPFQFTETSVSAIRSLLEECLSRLPGWPGDLHGSTVLLKPNLVRPERGGYRGICTDSRVILAMVELLRDEGARTVWVGDNPGVGYSCREALAADGLADGITERGGVPRYFDEESEVFLDLPDALVLSPVRVAAAAVECDVLVSLPKMKTHMHCLVSLGMKNLHGLLADAQRTVFHREDIHLKIVDITRACPPGLTVVDAIWPQEGQGPIFGSPVRGFNCVIAGWDVVPTDTVAARVMGFDPAEVTVLRVARALGMGGEEGAQVAGTDPSAVQRSFRRAVLSSQGAFPGVSVTDRGACSGCLSSLRHSLEALVQQELLSDVTPLAVGLGVPCGAGSLGDGTRVVLGDCFAARWDGDADLTVTGCPPQAFGLYRRIREALLPHVPERF